MSTKHTPGPWLYVKGDEWSHSVVTNEGELPSGEPSYWTVASINKNREPQHEANAHLIAAAPDLLEACKNALDILMTDRQAFVDCNRLRDGRTDDPIAHGLVLVQEDAWITPEDAEALRDYDRAIDIASASIAKATGSAT